MTKSDFTVLSKIYNKPMVKDNQLYYNGKTWDIKQINHELYSLDTDVYAMVAFDDDFNILIQNLVSEAKLSLWFDDKLKSWKSLYGSTNIQEQFNDWLNEISIEKNES